MCGIIGILNRADAIDQVKKGLNVIRYRGKDGEGFFNEGNCAIGHCLHSVVNFVRQPFNGKGRLIANCEIYNWEELNDVHKLNAKNDAEVIFLLLEKFVADKIKDILDWLDGVYAFAYWLDNRLFLARDIIGEKPIWYSHTNGFAFASEKKALEKLDYLDINELNPRKILVYDIKNDSINFFDRDFFDISPENRKNYKKIKNELSQLIQKSIKKRIPEKKFGILFSGGIDSTLIALICKKMKLDFTCYTAVLDEPGLIAEDCVYAENIAKDLKLNHKVIKIKLESIPNYLTTIVPLIEDNNVVKAGVALTFFVACEEAKKDGVKVIFSGLGSEELFAGYDRHKNALPDNINKECLSGLLKMYERDTYRDDVITMFNNLELRTPFLDLDLTKYSLKIPGKYKIKDNIEKFILHEIVEELGSSVGLKKEFAWRKKKAAQYGSRFDKAIERLTHRAGLKFKSDYLLRFYPSHNLKLGALLSGGKDSIYATYLMKKQNYKISCAITLISNNPDSYMFHTPNINLVKLQAEAMNIPLIEQKTKGEKEKELLDLKKALESAKNNYKIEGVITGALYSNYQRERIEKICDSLGLKIFSPLWHINQETEMRELIANGFNVILSSIAADGLDRTWLGKTINEKFKDKLVELNKKNGLNIAGEGGEYESLVLDSPLFEKKIVIEKSEIIEENKNTARLKVIKARLEKK